MGFIFISYNWNETAYEKTNRKNIPIESNQYYRKKKKLKLKNMRIYTWRVQSRKQSHNGTKTTTWMYIGDLKYLI